MKIYEANGNRFLIGCEEVNAVLLCKKYECDGYLRVFSHRMQVINADGSEADLCVNGLHCFAHYLYDEKSCYDTYALVIKNEVYKCDILCHEPFMSTITLKQPSLYRNFVHIGNEHMILFDENMHNAKQLCERFECNINYVHVLSRASLEVITYERGVGFTKSCGSGNSASSYYCYVNDLCDRHLEIHNQGGISFVDIGHQIENKAISKFVREV